MKWLDQPMQVYRTANGYLGKAALAAGRTPPAHPEGYLEAFANIYKNFASAIRARLEKTQARQGRSRASITRRSKTASAAWPSSKPWCVIEEERRLDEAGRVASESSALFQHRAEPLAQARARLAWAQDPGVVVIAESGADDRESAVVPDAGLAQKTLGVVGIGAFAADELRASAEPLQPRSAAARSSPG